MPDILSQDEIDRLLNVSPTETTPDGSELGPEEVEPVEKLTKVLFASANSALGALLARSASVSEGLGQAVDIADLDNGKNFLARFPFRSGFSGELAFLLPHQEASSLADLILGGEGTAKETLGEDDLDALKEALTQVTGSGAPPLSATLGREVGFDPPDVQVVEQGALAEALPWEHAFLGLGTIVVDDLLETPLRILLPIAIAREMAQIMTAEEEAEDSAAATAAPIAPLAEEPPGIGQPSSAPVPAHEIRNIDLILDIEVEVMVRLGEAIVPLRDIQRLRPGSIIDLDKDTESPVELVVNDKIIAKGELVVVGTDHFALRLTEIETPTERIRTLGP